MRILSDARQFAPQTGTHEVVEELYWLLLSVAAGFIILAICFVTERIRLWWQLAVGFGLLVVLGRML